MNSFDFSSISKAIAAGLVGAVVAVLARYGFHPQAETVTALGVVVTALVGYGVSHLVVYFAPKNTPKL